MIDPSGWLVAHRRRLAFASVAVLATVIFATGLVLAGDVWLHARYARSAGLNVWGYRGPVVGKKRPGERRIAVVGGSTAFGYGVTWDEAFPAILEQKLNQRRAVSGTQPVSVVNLAYNGEGAYAFRQNLRDFAYLGYDFVIMYSGYNDLLPQPNTWLPRQSSPVFRLTGYMPIFPLAFHEKAEALRSGGAKRAAFGPPPPNDLRAATLEMIVKATGVLDERVGRRLPPDGGLPAGAGAECGEWAFYCANVSASIDFVLSRGKKIMFVTQPYVSERHIEQQKVLVVMLKRRYAGQTSVTLANLGSAIEMRDPDLCFDGMHLTFRGNQQVADLLVTPVLEQLSIE